MATPGAARHIGVVQQNVQRWKIILRLRTSFPRLWNPFHVEETSRPQRGPLRAAARADLQHLQGFLAAVGREHEVSSLFDEDDALSLMAERQAGEVGRIADELEGVLGGRR